MFKLKKQEEEVTVTVAAAACPDRINRLCTQKRFKVMSIDISIHQTQPFSKLRLAYDMKIFSLVSCSWISIEKISKL